MASSQRGGTSCHPERKQTSLDHETNKAQLQPRRNPIALYQQQSNSSPSPIIHTDFPTPSSNLLNLHRHTNHDPGSHHHRQIPQSPNPPLQTHLYRPNQPLSQHHASANTLPLSLLHPRGCQEGSETSRLDGGNDEVSPAEIMQW